MSGIRRIIRSREFKVAAVERMAAGENVVALARELEVDRGLLYRWRDAYRSGGPDSLSGPGPRRGRTRKRKRVLSKGPSGAQLRIAALEKKIGQQQLELDFFQRALRQVEAAERNAEPGRPRSTRSSK
jgi:transposase